MRWLQICSLWECNCIGAQRWTGGMKLSWLQQFSNLSNISPWNYFQDYETSIKGDRVHSWWAVPVSPLQVTMMMRSWEVVRQWKNEMRWWTSWSDEVIKRKYCFRQDLEVPKEGNYFSFKGDPRSETNQDVKRKVKWLNNIQWIWDY